MRWPSSLGSSGRGEAGRWSVETGASGSADPSGAGPGGLPSSWWPRSLVIGVSVVPVRSGAHRVDDAAGRRHRDLRAAPAPGWQSGPRNGFAPGSIVRIEQGSQTPRHERELAWSTCAALAWSASKAGALGRECRLYVVQKDRGLLAVARESGDATELAGLAAEARQVVASVGTTRAMAEP
jgi:hypothetical protein